MAGAPLFDKCNRTKAGRARQRSRGNSGELRLAGQPSAPTFASPISSSKKIAGGAHPNTARLQGTNPALARNC
jgi:hypothetical protein